jgi:hypothetical protein
MRRKARNRAAVKPGVSRAKRVSSSAKSFPWIVALRPPINLKMLWITRQEAESALYNPALFPCCDKIVVKEGGDDA